MGARPVWILCLIGGGSFLFLVVVVRFKVWWCGVMGLCLCLCLCLVIWVWV